MTKDMDVKESLIKDIYDLSDKIESRTKELEKLKENIDFLTSEMEEAKSQLLKLMKEDEEIELHDNNLVAHYFKKSEFSYGDEKALLSKLQEMNLSQYIKVTTKTTTAIDKNALKKDLKTKEDLKESLKDFVGDRVTEYVVVTTEEKHQRMLEHIGGKE